MIDAENVEGIAIEAIEIDDALREQVNIDDGALSKLLNDCNVIVYPTGAEAVIERAGPRVQMMEYRHTPDPRDILRLVMPFLTSYTGSRINNRKDAL